MPTPTAEGIFAQWQPRYAEHGIPTFPVGAEKRPAVRGYLKIGTAASRQLAIKFPAIDAFGIALGKRNKITVLDVDTSDERVLADALSRYGKTPFIVRSGSGNHQAWYRHSGEKRRIRPVPNVPIDILGDGFVVAPPSRGSKGAYELITGHLDDLNNLPTMSRPIVTELRPADRIRTGQRNDALFRRALVHARHSDDLDSLLDALLTENQTCDEPLDDAEVVKVARSAWGYEERGENFVRGGGRVYGTFNEIDDLAAADPDALALLLILRRTHYDRKCFALANAMAKSLGWPLRRFRGARLQLETYGAITCVRRGGRGKNDPPVYAWAKVSNNAHQ